MKAKILFILFFICVIGSSAKAQWSYFPTCNDSVYHSLGANGAIYSTCSDANGNIYVAGVFNNSNRRVFVAKWNGNSWSELPDLNYQNYGGSFVTQINSICCDAFGNVYAAGGFVNYSTVPYVAKWNGTTWSELGGYNSLAANSYINSICSDAAGNIYAAGSFTNGATSSAGSCYVAKYDGTSWSELGGLNALAANDKILSICVDASGNIYAAGSFTNGGLFPNNYSYVSKWDGTAWSALGGLNGLAANSSIYSICSDASGNIYAAGDFGNISGERYVAKWNGTTWSELGGLNSLAANAVINSITVDTSGNVLAGGDFTNFSGKRYVAKWNGTTWSELGGINSLAANRSINTIYSDLSGNIYAGGWFSNSNWKQYVAKYNGNFWNEPLGFKSMAINGVVESMICDGTGNIYAAGNLFNSAGQFYVAKWNGTILNELGSNDSLVAGTIYSLCKDAAGNIYAAGYITNANGSRNVAKFDGTIWSELGGVNSLSANSDIQSICSDNVGNIYAAGTFTNTSGNNYVAKFDGTIWSELGGINSFSAYGVIYTICSDNAGNIYAAGYFKNANGKCYVAKYDGTTWSELGGVNSLSANDYIQSICSDNAGNIYAAGNFTNANGNRYVAKFDGTTWSELGGNNSLKANSWINTIYCDAAANIYVGGGFHNLNYYTYVAKWNGSVWKELGGANGLSGNTYINSICGDAAGNIYVANKTVPFGGYYLIGKYYCKNDTTFTQSSVCSSFLFNGHTLSLSGTYYDTLINQNGCDSFIVLHLIVGQNVFYSTINQSICNGSYVFNNHSLTVSGTYYDTLNNYQGCDSIIILNLTVNPITTYSFSQTICSNQSVIVGLHTYNTTGIYQDTLVNYLGCDSIVTLNLTVNQVPVANFSLSQNTATQHSWFALNQCSATNPPLTYSWYWGDGTANDTGATPNHTYASAGWYNICVTVTDVNGCSAIYCDSSYLSRMNGGNSMVSINAVMQLPNGINAVDSKNALMQIVPNPCSTCEVILNTTVGMNELQITDLLSRKVEAIFTKSAKGYLIDMNSANAGVYFIRNTKTGQVLKFIKE